ncbi:unnamed protein product [Arabis nemorensis]|uniref:Uncharacterized protein n=1 Tax=Arabis nemorensis TaxID=586526 RepID=A0A565BJD8_9BRAS|nr:unnamed protein product [Arabis nemorensis]
MDSYETTAAEPKKGKTSCAQNCGKISPARILQTSLSFQEKNPLYFRFSHTQDPIGTISGLETTVQLMTLLPWPDPASSASRQSNPLDPPDCRESLNPTQISSHRVQQPNHELPVMFGRVLRRRLVSV